MDSFVSILGLIIGVLADCWAWFYEMWPAIAISMLIGLFIISMIITRLLNPMLALASRRISNDIVQGRTHSHKTNKSKND